MPDDMTNRFIVTEMNTSYGVTLTLQSTGEYDFGAVFAMFGQVVTIQPVSEARHG